MLNWQYDSEEMFLATQLVLMDLQNTDNAEAQEHMNECSREALQTGGTKM